MSEEAIILEEDASTVETIEPMTLKDIIGIIEDSYLNENDLIIVYKFSEDDMDNFIIDNDYFTENPEFTYDSLLEIEDKISRIVIIKYGTVEGTEPRDITFERDDAESKFVYF